MARLSVQRVSLLVGVFTTASFVLQAPVACAGRLEGSVRLAPRIEAQQAAINPYPATLGSICNGTSTFTPPGDSPHDVVLTLENVPASARPAPPTETPRLAQVGLAFQPRVLAIPVGATVEFPNQDPIFHNVFSYSKTKRFDLGKYGKGKTARVTFDTPGVVQVFCDIHSNMNGYIVITETPWVIQPDAQGRFVLDGVPDGTYVLRSWHPERGSRTISVTIPGPAIELQL